MNFELHLGPPGVLILVLEWTSPPVVWIQGVELEEEGQSLGQEAFVSPASQVPLPQTGPAGGGGGGGGGGAGAGAGALQDKGVVNVRTWLFCLWS